MAFLGITFGTNTPAQAFGNRVNDAAKDGFNAAEATELRATFQKALEAASGEVDAPLLKAMKAALAKYPGLLAYVQKADVDSLPDAAKARIDAAGSAAFHKTYAADTAKGIDRVKVEGNAGRAQDVAREKATEAELSAFTTSQLNIINIGNSGWKAK